MNQNKITLILNHISQLFVFVWLLSLSIGEVSAVSTNQGDTVAPSISVKEKSFGKTLSQWMMLHQEWFLRGQDPQTGTIGSVNLLPLPQSEPVPVPPVPTVEQFSVGTLDLTLKTGLALVVPVITLNGESFLNDIIPPDKTLPIYTQSLLSAQITVTLDDVLILQSPTDNQRFFYGPAFFPEPVVYDPPQFRFNDSTLGDVYAAAAIWSQGIGFVLPHLKIGSHTLRVYALNTDLKYGFDNTWHITVKR